jgi:hypothetical protein
MTRASRIALAGALSVLVARPAHADSLWLDWVAPPGCSDRDDVAARVRAIIGDSPGSRALSVRAETRPLPGGRLRVTLVIEGGDARRRQLDVESCDAAADATALIIALILNPTQTGTPRGATSTQEIPPAPAPPPPPPEPMPPPSPTGPGSTAPALLPIASPVTAEPPPPRPMSPVRLVASVPQAEPRPTAEHPLPALTLSGRLSLAGDVGTLGSPDIGGEVAIAASVGVLRVELAGSAWAPSTSRAPNEPSEGAHLYLFSIGARVAYRFPLGRLTLSPLVGGEVDIAPASGFASGTGDASHEPTAVFWGIGAGGVLGLPVSRRFALALAVEGVVPVTRPEFVVQGAGGGLVERPSAIVGRTFLGGELRFF